LAESSAETKAAGIKKTRAENTKKKMRVVPKRAEAGKLRMLSTVPVISMARVKVLMRATDDGVDMKTTS
jgi:hypothetical protein